MKIEVEKTVTEEREVVWVDRECLIQGPKGGCRVYFHERDLIGPLPSKVYDTAFELIQENRELEEDETRAGDGQIWKMYGACRTKGGWPAVEVYADSGLGRAYSELRADIQPERNAYWNKHYKTPEPEIYCSRAEFDTCWRFGDSQIQDCYDLIVTRCTP